MQPSEKLLDIGERRIILQFDQSDFESIGFKHFSGQGFA